MGRQRWSGEGVESEARGAPAQLPAAISSPHFKETARQELHSELAQAALTPGAPCPLPSAAPSPSTPLFQAPTSSPAPASRGARVRQGGGRPTAQGRGPRAGLGPGAPHPSRGAPLRPTPSLLLPPPPPGGVSPKPGAREAEGEPWRPGQAPSRAHANGRLH